MLLQTGKSTQYKIIIIFDHAVESITIKSEAKTELPELLLSPHKKLSLQAIANRKSIITKLLLDNRFPIREEGDNLTIDNVLSIEPPYFPENCKCTNSIILGRIQNILEHANIE